MVKVQIICPEHGSFFQTPFNHKQGQGCPQCSTNKKEEFLTNLFKDYNIPHLYNNREIIKQKFWVLDGPVNSNEGISDNDYNNPKDHYNWLANELVYLDKYVRTLDNELGTDIDFENFKEQKQKLLLYV